MKETSGRDVSVAIVNFNGGETLPDVLRAVLAQEGARVTDVRVVDNNSQDGSADLVAARFPGVSVTRLAENRGPNPARNAGLALAANDCVLVMDNDILLAPDYIALLLAAHARDPDAGAATGQIRFAGSPGTVQYNGTFIHYAGEIMLNRRESPDPLKVGCVSAGAVLLDRRKVKAVGGFDEDFFIGWEDGDLTFRLALAGYPCYAVSAARCYHVSRARNSKWVRLQTRNRWWFMFKNYDARTLALAMPAILALQAAAGLYFLFRGRGLDFAKGIADFLASLGALRAKRWSVQALKKIGDRRLLRGERLDLPGGGRVVNAAFGFVLRCYWLLIRPFLKKDS